jgi:hypothetical protein
MLSAIAAPTGTRSAKSSEQNNLKFIISNYTGSSAGLARGFGRSAATEMQDREVAPP